jgi:hypothetical protein
LARPAAALCAHRRAAAPPARRHCRYQYRTVSPRVPARASPRGRGGSTGPGGARDPPRLRALPAGRGARMLKVQGLAMANQANQANQHQAAYRCVRQSIPPHAATQHHPHARISRVGRQQRRVHLHAAGTWWRVLLAAPGLGPRGCCVCGCACCVSCMPGPWGAAWGQLQLGSCPPAQRRRMEVGGSWRVLPATPSGAAVRQVLPCCWCVARCRGERHGEREDLGLRRDEGTRRRRTEQSGVAVRRPLGAGL